MRADNKILGFTLLEMILVLAIMSSIIVLLMNYGTARMTQFRRDRTALQMQQVMNAGLAYYVTNGAWPLPCVSSSTPAALQAGQDTLIGGQLLLTPAAYLPQTIVNTPYGAPNHYGLSCATPPNGGFFLVSAVVPTLAEAVILAGQLPVGTYYCGNPWAACIGPNPAGPYTVTGQVQIPGQNLNNARSVNFAALYHHGACVPVPVCPTGMQPEILVTPASVAGVNDAPTRNGSACTTTAIYQQGSASPDSPSPAASDCNQINLYPISEFSAFSTAPAAAGAVSGPPSCDNTQASAPCYSNVTGSTWTVIDNNNLYWRVCLSVMTEKGLVSPTSASAGYTFSATTNTKYLYWVNAMGAVMAATRCTPSANPEPIGSDSTVSGF